MSVAKRSGGSSAGPSSPSGRGLSDDSVASELRASGPGLDWLADALSEAGLTVHETIGWRSRAQAGPFAPVGVLIHHTEVLATPEAPAPSLAAMIGVDDAPASRGPRCHVLIDRNAECWVVAGGRAHHAGRARASGPVPEGDADTLFVGVQIEYAATSTEPTQYATSVQKSVAVLAAARIVGALGHDHRYVRAHKETSTTGRTDPFNWDMVSIRDSVRQTLERTGW
ncbi:peptidoglycan recognition protein family protein [Terrabacter sp. 2YAF2]|uniref:peptidoglycan recognition protein family protein n=1 Tax=Terrabacter sp. 2YAF2 TaxID=3233026 RepID=UPI003F9A4565